MTHRILVVHPFPDVYGADRVLLDAVTAFRESGMAPTVVLPEAGPMTDWLDERSLPYRYVGTPVLRRALLRPDRLLGLAYRARHHFSLIRQIVAELNPDLVYVNTITLPHWVLGARQARVPVVVHVHESDDRIAPAVARALVAPLLAADRIVTVSNASKAFLLRLVPKLGNRIIVIYNGVTAPPNDFPAPLDSKVARLAVVGRLNPNKGQDLAIATVRSLVDRERNIRLELAGGTFAGYERVERALRESVQELGLGGRVQFTGFCTDVWGLLARTDILMAPSRTDSLPLVVIEAMLAGRPVVAADVGGMRELIEDGVSGLLARREDVKGFTACVEALLDEPLMAQRMGVQARAVAVDRFSRDRFERQIVEAVDDVLVRSRRS